MYTQYIRSGAYIYIQYIHIGAYIYKYIYT